MPNFSSTRSCGTLAYAGLLKTRRGHLHAAIANALEQKFPEVAQSQPETLAHHLTEAGLIDKAIGYWLQAARSRLALRQHRGHGACAARHRGDRPLAGRENDGLQLDLHLVLGPCLIATHGPAAGKAVATFTRARELCERLGEPPEYLQVMFWLATASVVRGELPQALEGHRRIAEHRRSARQSAGIAQRNPGQAMKILMFMGRIADARDTLERALEVFGASRRIDRIAARVAGQDAGVSMLVLMAWVLSILGHPTRPFHEWKPRLNALMRSSTRIRTLTPGIMPPFFTLCAASRPSRKAMPSVVSPYRSNTDSGNGSGCTTPSRGICMAMLDTSGSRLDEVVAELGEYQTAGYQLGITAQFVLLCPALLLQNKKNPRRRWRQSSTACFRS